MRQYPGYLISIEGIDGSGKSTIVNSLYESVSETHEVMITKEPGQTQLGKKIRNILQQEKNLVCDRAEYLLFAADRAQHFEEVVIPALKKGKVVISDRMADSSIAYQGYGRGLDIDLIKTINKWCMRGIEPDLILYLDIDEKTALQRIYQRKQLLTAFEKESTAFWKRIRKGFDETLKNRQNVAWIDGTQNPLQVAKQAHDAIMDML